MRINLYEELYGVAFDEKCPFGDEFITNVRERAASNDHTLALWLLAGHPAMHDQFCDEYDYLAEMFCQQFLRGAIREDEESARREWRKRMFDFILKVYGEENLARIRLAF